MIVGGELVRADASEGDVNRECFPDGVHIAGEGDRRESLCVDGQRSSPPIQVAVKGNSEEMPIPASQIDKL